MKNEERIFAKQKSKEILDRKEKDARIIARFLEFYAQSLPKAVKNNKNVLLYYPRQDEINILPLFDRLLNEGKEIYLPKVVSEAEIVFYKFNPDMLVSGRFGIKEPDSEQCAKLDLFDNNLIIVPNLCCSVDFTRMGQGGGFYDRFLAGKMLFKTAFVYEEMLEDTLCAEMHDIKMDVIITENKTLRKG